MVAHIGLEIDWNIVRCCVVDPLAISPNRARAGAVIAYLDDITLEGPNEQGFLDQRNALRNIWQRLEIDTPYQVCVSIGNSSAGIVESDFPDLDISQLAERHQDDLAWRPMESGRVAYIRSDYLDAVIGWFDELEISIHRIELAPESVERVLKSDFSGRLAVTSGTGWTVEMSGGKLVSAETDLSHLASTGTRVITNKSERDLTTIQNISIPEDLFNRTQIKPGAMLVVAGAALGAASFESGFGDSNVAQQFDSAGPQGLSLLPDSLDQVEVELEVDLPDEDTCVSVEGDDVYEPVVVPEVSLVKQEPDKDADMVNFVNSAQEVVGNHIGAILEHVQKTRVGQRPEIVEEL